MRAVLLGVLVAAVLVSLFAMAVLQGETVVGNATYTGFDAATVRPASCDSHITHTSITHPHRTPVHSPHQLRSNLWPSPGMDASDILAVVPPTNSAAFIIATLLPAATGSLTALASTPHLTHPRAREVWCVALMCAGKSLRKGLVIAVGTAVAVQVTAAVLLAGGFTRDVLQVGVVWCGVVWCGEVAS